MADNGCEVVSKIYKILPFSSEIYLVSYLSTISNSKVTFGYPDFFLIHKEN